VAEFSELCGVMHLAENGVVVHIVQFALGEDLTARWPLACEVPYSMEWQWVYHAKTCIRVTQPRPFIRIYKRQQVFR